MGKTQKITLYDKVQAFIRLSNPEMFIKGCYVNSLPEYYGMTTLKESNNGHTFVRTGTIGNVENFYEKISSPVTAIPPWEQIKTSTVSDRDRMNPKSLIRDGRYLVVSIDLTRGKTDITNDLHSLIDICGKYTKKSKGRKNRKHDIDIWKVFDLCNQPAFKKTDGTPKYANIVKVLYGKNAFYDTNRQSVKKAYDKSCKIMKTVMKEIS